MIKGRFKKGLASSSLLVSTLAFVANAEGNQLSQKSAVCQVEKSFLSRFFSFFIFYIPGLLKKKIELNRINRKIKVKEASLKKCKNYDYVFKLKSESDSLTKRIVELSSKKLDLERYLRTSTEFSEYLKDRINNGYKALRSLDPRSGEKTFSEEFSRGYKIYLFILEQNEVKNFNKKILEHEQEAKSSFEKTVKLIYEDKEQQSMEFSEQNFKKVKNIWYDTLKKRVTNKKTFDNVSKEVRGYIEVIDRYWSSCSREKRNLEEMRKELEQFKKGPEYAALEVEKVGDLILSTVSRVEKIVKTVENYLGEGNSYTKYISQKINEINSAENLESKLASFVILKDLFNDLLKGIPSLVKDFQKEKDEMLKQRDQLLMDVEILNWQIKKVDEELEKLKKEKDKIFTEVVEEKYKKTANDFYELEVLKSRKDAINGDSFSF